MNASLFEWDGVIEWIKDKRAVLSQCSGSWLALYTGSSGRLLKYAAGQRCEVTDVRFEDEGRRRGKKMRRQRVSSELWVSWPTIDVWGTEAASLACLLWLAEGAGDCFFFSWGISSVPVRHGQCFLWGFTRLWPHTNRPEIDYRLGLTWWHPGSVCFFCGARCESLLTVTSPGLVRGP